MTVSELIQVLQTAPPDFLVVMSRDPEGNGFSPLDEVEVSNSSYKEGEVGIHRLKPDLTMVGFTEEDIMQGGERCIVLWPNV